MPHFAAKSFEHAVLDHVLELGVGLVLAGILAPVVAAAAVVGMSIPMVTR